MALLGSSIDPSLFSNDYSGFAKAGAIQGESYAQMGKDIGGAIVDYAKINQAVKKQNSEYSAQKRSNASYIDSALKLLGDRDPAMAARLRQSQVMMNDSSLPLDQQYQISENAKNDVTAHVDLGYKIGRMNNAQRQYQGGGGGQVNAPTNDSYPWD